MYNSMLRFWVVAQSVGYCNFFYEKYTSSPKNRQLFLYHNNSEHNFLMCTGYNQALRIPLSRVCEVK